MSALHHDALAAALRDDTAGVILAIYDMSTDELDRLLEAVQLIDREAQDCLEAAS